MSNHIKQIKLPNGQTHDIVIPITNVEGLGNELEVLNDAIGDISTILSQINARQYGILNGMESTAQMALEEEEGEEET